jgi:WD40 repeat protein
MHEQQVEHSLSRLKDSIEINRELQTNLRKELETLQLNRRRRSRRRWSVTAVTAAVIAIAVFFSTISGPSEVSAASLRVSSQISFAEIGAVNPLGAAEYGGTIYIPVFGKGLYVYDTQGMHQISFREINEISISPDGKSLAWSSGGTVGIYDTQSKKWKELQKGGGDGTVYFENPSWETNSRLLFVRREIAPRETHGFETKSSEIMEFDMKSGTQRKLADGSFPSFAKGKDLLVYQKDSDTGSHIVTRRLDGGEEHILDSGRFPSVSPNGKYVSYVKMEQNRRELKPGASVVINVPNVWIADTDGSSKKALTENTPWVKQDEQQWAKSLDTSKGVPYVLAVDGMYSYYNPSWSSDSGSIFVVKGKNAEGSKMTLNRIDLTKKVLPAEETVKAFERAAIRHDDDFARSLLKNPTDYMYVSNPHRISFRVLGSGEENGQEYVDVEETWGNTSQPHASIGKVRYLLEKKDHGGYQINRMENLKDGVLVQQMPDESVVLEKESGRTVLFKPNDIPDEVKPDGKWRLASLAYESQSNSILFTVQSLGQDTGVSLVRYDISSQSFTLIERISRIGTSKNLGVENLIVSPDGLYAALDLFSEDEAPARSHVLVYDLKNKKADVLDDKFAGTVVDGTHSFYMEGSTLYFTMTTTGFQLQYSWDAGKKKLMRP